MNKKPFSLTALACALQLPSASAAVIAGSDFSSAAIYTAGAAGSSTAASSDYDIALSSTDDLNPTDNITVSDWSFANAGKFQNWDFNAQASMPVGVGPAAVVTKIDGDNQGQPLVGSSDAGYASVSFTINIPAGTQLDLTSVTWDWRKATGSGNVRWLAFNTSLDGGLITFSELGDIRPNVQNANVDLSGAIYQGLTDTSVTFNWYAGGQGSGDIDFDTPTVNGDVSAIPEPSSIALLALAGLGAVRRRR